MICKYMGWSWAAYETAPLSVIQVVAQMIHEEQLAQQRMLAEQRRRNRR